MNRIIILIFGVIITFLAFPVGAKNKVEVTEIAQVSRINVHKFIDKLPDGTTVVCYIAVSSSGGIGGARLPVLNCIKQAE